MDKDTAFLMHASNQLDIITDLMASSVVQDKQMGDRLFRNIIDLKRESLLSNEILFSNKEIDQSKDIEEAKKEYIKRLDSFYNIEKINLSDKGR